MKHLIWDNTEMVDANYEDIVNNLDQYDIEEDDPLKVQKALEIAHEWNDSDLADDLSDLDIDVGYPIVVFADLGLWNGRRTAYRMLGSQNIKDCMNVCCGDYIEWFVDEKGDLIIRDTHHDGTNTYTFRAMRGCMSETQIDNFFEKLDTGITRAAVKRYTRRLGDYVAKVYGWKLPGGIHTER